MTLFYNRTVNFSSAKVVVEEQAAKNIGPGLLICKYQAGQKWPVPHYVGGLQTGHLQ